MKKIKISFYTILISLVLLNCYGCKKAHQYPLDSGHSKASKDKRIEGAWKLIQVYIDGADSTLQFQQSSLCGCNLGFGDGNKRGHCQNYAKNFSYEFQWGWGKDSDLWLKAGLINPIPNENFECHILVLYERNLKFTIIHPQTGKKYYFHYQQI